MNRTQRGVGLIEVLISMLIFLLGVLGVAGLQGQAIRVTHDSLQRSQAVWMANEIAERMKVNTDGLDSNMYQTLATTASTDITAYCALPPASCIGTSCSADQMAAYDVYDLMCKNMGIINPQLTITCSTTPCAAGTLISVGVSWDSRGATGGIYSTRQQLSLNMRRK